MHPGGLSRLYIYIYSGVTPPPPVVDAQQELIDTFEETFARCRRQGVEVFITTSHSAPYESTQDQARFDIVDAWAKSDNVG